MREGRRHYVFSNVVSLLALSFALGASSAWATHELILSSDIQDGEVKAVDLAANSVAGGKVVNGSLSGADVGDGTLTGADIQDGWITTYDIDESLNGLDIRTGGIYSSDIADDRLTGVDVKDDSLTGADIQESTLEGVGTPRCHAGALLFGRLCAGGGSSGSFFDATRLCAGIGLRLPTWGEASYLAFNHDVPGVSDGEWFWTDEVLALEGNTRCINLMCEFRVLIVNESGVFRNGNGRTGFKIVCVETPTNLP